MGHLYALPVRGRPGMLPATAYHHIGASPLDENHEPKYISFLYESVGLRLRYFTLVRLNYYKWEIQILHYK